MTQATEREKSSILSVKSIGSSIKRLLKDYVATTALIASISFTYQTLLSPEYWNFVKQGISNSTNTFVSLFTYSTQYTLANLSLIIFVVIFIRLTKPKSWLDKIQYNQREQLSFYVTQLLLQGSEIGTKEELNNFCQDTVDIVHSLFAQKSSVNNSTWLIPEGNKLVLFCSNKNSKYSREEKHFAFRSGEGVVGNSWKSGEIEFYSEQQENRYYKNRKQCGDRAYICCPVIKSPQNKYGILAVGSDENVYWEDEDKECLNLISTVVSKTINDLDDELKAQFSL